MIAGMIFLSGIGFATFFIYGWQQLYELIRHRSMLEYPTPEISVAWCFFAGLGFLLWVIGSWFGGSP